MEAGHACCAPRLHSSLLLDAREVAGATPAVGGLQPEEGELLARGEVPPHELQLVVAVVGQGPAVARRLDVPALAVGERDEESAVLHDQIEIAAHLDEGLPLLVRPVADPGAVVADPLVAVLVHPDVDVAEDPHPLVSPALPVLVRLVRLRLLDEGREAPGLARPDGEDAVVLAVLHVAALTHLTLRL